MDQSAPVLVSRNPEGSRASTNPRLSLTFNEEVKLGTGKLIIHEAGDGQIAGTVWVSGGTAVIGSGHSYDRTAEFNIWHALESGTSYYVEITSGLITDRVGNPYAGITSPSEWTFQTVDRAPFYNYFSPDRASGVGIQPTLMINFSEDIYLGNGGLEIYRQSDGQLVQRISSSGGNISISGYHAFINLPEALEDNTSYYVEVSSGTFVDRIGQSFGGIQNPGTWNFRTMDQSAPVLVSRDPEGSGASTNPRLSLTFNEEVKLGTGKLIIHEAGDGQIAGTVWVSGGTAVIGSGHSYDRTAEFNIRHALESGTSYYVEITSGLITDRAGNPYAGISSPSEWTFQTVDRAPFYNYFSPNRASGVGIQPTLMINFSEDIYLGTGGLEIYRQSDGQLVQRISSSGGNISISGYHAFINLPKALEDNTGYYVEVSSGMFVDRIGQSFGGIQNPGTWNFRTMDQSAPVLVSRDPEGSGASTNPRLSLTFNEEVKLGTGKLIIHEAGDGQIAGTVWVSGGTAVIGSGHSYDRTAEFNIWHALESGTSYYVEITSGLITDRVGNPYAGITSPSEWTFQTIGQVGSEVPNPQPEEPNQSENSPSNPAREETASPINRTALIETAKITETKDADSLTLIDIDRKALSSVLTDLNNDVSDENIVIDASRYGASVQINLPLRAFDELESKSNIMISIKSGYAQYLLPVQLVKEWSLTYPAESLSITISALEADINKIVDNAALAQGVNLAEPGAVEFTIKAGDVEITDFHKTYVERKLLLNEILESENSTAVWYNPEKGELQFVPSFFVEVDGHSEVSVKTEHNSIYTVISADKNFADMSNHWAKDDVELMANKLIIKGITPDRFDPNRSITRSEFVALVVRGLGLSEKVQTGEFTDVSSDDWFAGSMGAAVEAGLIQGFGDHTFRPNDLITREEMAYISEKAIQYADSSEQTTASLEQLKYTDAGSVSSWAADSMAQAVDHGLMKGVSDDVLAPKQKASRAEAASVIKRVLKFLKFIN
jgi:hypothetical protein